VNLTLDAVAAHTSGRAVGTATVTSVSTDSRAIDPGSLFVALRGEHHDGHDFVEAALAGGAAACLVESGRLPTGAAGVEVADTLRALADLAAARRASIDAPVVAITGSNGKTTTKDMTAAALGPGCHASPHSYNNEVGVPLTILSVPADASAVVVEVGSRGAGHIAALGAVVRPDVAVITNIGPAHLETFGSVETVARAKWELVESLGPGGVAILPEDLDPQGALPARVLRFGYGESADVAVVDLTVDARARVRCTVRHRGQAVPLVLEVPGRHLALNAAAALAVAVTLGRPLAVATRSVGSAPLSPWRMQVAERRVADGSITVVNDAYNANPASMAAALETVAAMPGRHLAVLGRMHELGDDESRFHEEAGALAAALGFAAVVVVGEDPGFAAGAGALARPVPDGAAALALLDDLVGPGDVVLVKASRAAGLETVAAALAGEEAA
jgi:UDP-N-acetylmuramoyl-tripeptide--D-alanyl-D-alanine ligase